MSAPLRLPASRLRLGGVVLLLAGLAGPAAAADFELEAFKLDLGGVVISAPRLVVKGSPLERDAFRALLTGSSGEPAAQRMAKLTAAEITAPELRFEQVLGPQTQTTSYRDIAFRDVREGVIGRGESPRGTLSVTGAAAGPMSGEVLATRFEGLDLRQIARVFGERAQAGVPERLQPVIGRYEIDGYTVDMSQAGRFSLGRSSGRGLALKVGEEPLGEVLSRFVAAAEASEKATRAGKDVAVPSPDDRRAGLALLSLFDSMDYGSGEARDFSMTINTPPSPGAKPEQVSFSIGRIAYGEDTPAKSGFAIERMAFTGGGSSGRIESMTHAGFSLGPVIAELKALLAKPDMDPDTIDLRKFVPTLGTLRLAGFSVEVPQERRRGQPARSMTIGLGAFEMKAAEQLNGIPTNLTLTLDNLVVPVVEGAGNPSARDLLAMGYKSLDLSARIEMAWEAARSELALRALSLSGAGMGRFDISGTLGNVTKDVFAADMALAQVAALGATIRAMETRVQNLGLIEKLIENEARKGKRRADDVRREYATMASLGLASILGPSEAAKTLASAVSRFVAKPGTLSVQASAKSPSGLGLADMLTLTDPTDIFGKIDLKANAE